MYFITELPFHLATVAEKEAINTPPVAAAGGAAANDENNVHPAARALEPIRRLLQFLHWRLLLRMFLLYLLFFHNREMKDEKRYVIIGIIDEMFSLFSPHIRSIRNDDYCLYLTNRNSGSLTRTISRKSSCCKSILYC